MNTSTLKSVFLSCFLVCLSTLVFSQERVATFFAQDGDKFWVIVDGIRQNDKPAANVKVTGLTKDMYRIKIIFENETLKSIDQTITTVGFVDESEVTKPADVTYMVRRNKDKMVMRVSSFKPANSTAAAEPRQETVRFHTEENPTPTPPVQTTTQTTTTQTNRQQPSTTQKVGMDIKTDGLNTQVNIQMTEPMEQDMEIITTTRQTNTNPPPANTQPTAPPPAAAPQGCTKAMSALDFQKAKSSIEAQSFAESKMKIAKQAVRGCITTGQARELLGLFSFEADKLSFAKFAYDFTTDKNNYYTLSDVFSFSASSDALNDFLESKQK